MNPVSERPMRIAWAPVVYAAAVAAAILLGLVLPLPWMPRPLSDFAFAAGLVIAAGALWIAAAAVRSLTRAGTPLSPLRRAEHLVMAGPYAFSRNPIYLALTVLMLGAGLVFGLVWFIPAAILAAFLVQKLAVEAEERHLETRFGRNYRDYRKKVRRWI